MADVRYDGKAGRYRGAGGRFVAFRAVREAVDRTVDLASDRLAALAEQLRSGEITLADWQRQSMQLVKDVHVASGIAAHGGTARMDQETWGLVSRRVRDEYGYLREFAAQIADGTQPLNGRLVARARLYGQAGRGTFTAVEARDQRARGATLERNVLSPGEHCASCRGESAKGWVPIGTLSPPGTRACLSNCRCRVSYSFTAEIAA